MTARVDGHQEHGNGLPGRRHGLVWEPNAFVAFGDAADQAQVDAILRHTCRPQSRTVTPKDRVHALPLVRCACLVTDGPKASADAPSVPTGTRRGRSASGTGAAAAVQVSTSVAASAAARLERPCGHRLYAVYTHAHRWHYRSSRCVKARHHTAIASLIEAPVLAALAERFTPAALTGAVDQAWVAADGERGRLAELEREAEKAESLAAVTLTMAAEYRADGNEAQAVASKALSDRHSKDAQVKRARIATFRADTERLGTLVAEDKSRILALATELPRLFERAAHVPNAVARLVAVLLTAVHVRRRSKGLFDVGLEYPTGAMEWIAVTTQTVRAWQPERAYALGRLAEGATAAAVSRELNAHRGPDKFRTPWTPARVTGLAAQWAGRDPDEDARTRSGRLRMRPGSQGNHDAAVMGRPFGHTKGRHAGESAERIAPILEAGTSVEALAAMVGEPVATVWRLILRGKLGRAVYRDGTLHVAGASAHVDRQFPEHARRRMAAVTGWPMEDVVLVAHLAVELGHDTDYVERRARAGSGMRNDACLRKYARRSDVVPGPRRDPDRVI